MKPLVPPEKYTRINKIMRLVFYALEAARRARFITRVPIECYDFFIVFRGNRVSFSAGAHESSQPAGQIRASRYDRPKMGAAHDHESKHCTQEHGQKFYVLQYTCFAPLKSNCSPSGRCDGLSKSIALHRCVPSPASRPNSARYTHCDMPSTLTAAPRVHITPKPRLYCTSCNINIAGTLVIVQTYPPQPAGRRIRKVRRAVSCCSHPRRPRKTSLCCLLGVFFNVGWWWPSTCADDGRGNNNRNTTRGGGRGGGVAGAGRGVMEFRG